MASQAEEKVASLAWKAEAPRVQEADSLKQDSTHVLLAQLAGDDWGLAPATLAALGISLHGTAWAAPSSWFLLWACLMASYDLASRRIPNVLNAMACLSGLFWALALGGLWGLGQGLLAALVAGGLMAVFYFMGALGAGDVKALGALGAFMSPWGSLQLFLATTLCGGALALGYLIFTRRGALAWGGLGNLRVQGGGATLPYGLAIWGAAMLLVTTGGVR